FIELKKRVPEAKFHFGGWLGPANRDFYSRQLSRLRDAGVAESAVHLECPSLADKVAFMKGVDLLSVPTEYREPKGLYVLEAWAAGIPVVQPAHGSFPELLEMSGGGVLVAPGSLEGLANAWVDLAEAPQTRELMGKRGREAVESKFTDDIMASKTASWYSNLA
ncbi:MAG: glycosyltransferase, partial [Planctomycetota bacterium]